MLIEAKYPLKFDRESYDQYLEKGFFRGASMFYKTQMLCIGTQVSSVLNIRLPLSKHSYSKSQRKILRKVKKQFRVKMSSYLPTDQMETLYQAHKSRFKGFLYPDLASFLTMGSTSAYEIFDTYKVEVFDGDRLIAFSLFDLGKRSMASLLGVYDEEYASYSLGIFTMLYEVELAKGWHISYYYPGYILHNNRQFDYKLRIGEIEFLDWNKGWRKDLKNKPDHFLSDIIETRIAEAQGFLTGKGVQTEKRYYPNFSLGYLMPLPGVLRSPVFLDVNDTGLTGRIIIEFDYRTDKFRLGKIKPIHMMPDTERLEISNEYLNAKALELDLYEYERMIWSGTDFYEILSFLRFYKK